MIVRRTLLALAATSLLLVLCAGCLSPTLPLPPPSAPLVTAPDAQGFVRISGRVRPESSVFIRNQQTNKGVIQKTESSGQYDLTLSASVGDILSVWERRGSVDSHPIDVIVPEVTPQVGIPAPAKGAGGATPQ